jgi:PAS domain S-box-containing protein
MGSTAEIKRLQSCINDLISVLALPAIWSGSESSQILGTLLDVLLTMLRLDFAYARLSDASDGPPIEVVRLGDHRHSSVQPQQFGQALDRWLTGDQTASRSVIPDPAGEGEVSIASFSLGLQHEVGMLVAGSRRTDFPTEVERLLLRVAANQAGIGLQEARRSGEQKRIAEMLEQRVAERTRRLTAVNDELRRSEAYSAEAQRLSRTGSFGWRVSTGDIIWSEETFRIFQYDRTIRPTVELVLQRVHPEDAARVKQTIERASQDGKDFELEYRLVIPDGSVKYVHVVAHGLSDESGGIEFVGAVMDVTAAKEAEDKIQLIINTVPALIWTARPDGRLDFISQRWLDYGGMTLGQKLEGDIGEHSAIPDDIEQLRSKWRLAVAEGKPFEAEVRVRRLDGEYRWFLSRAFPLFDRSGRVLAWYGNDIDIHDRKQAEEKLRQAQADLAHVNRVTTVGELAASLAHEVNQPIAAAVTDANTCLRWLNRDHPDVEEAREAASRMVKDATRAAEIISRTRLLFKKGTPQWELVDINEIIREMVALMRSEVTRHSISVRTELAEDIPQITGDRVQLQQVMMNLIVNSIDAMKDVDGTREVALNSQRAENEQLLVSVSDTGVGLPPRQADQIFNAFFTTKLHGTGMGLSISRSIVESHGGRLWADDNSPRGASFYLTLPTKVEAHE